MTSVCCYEANLDMEFYFVEALILATGSLAQGLTGFGFALVSVSVLSLLRSPIEAVSLVAILAPVQVFWNWKLHRKDVAYHSVFPILIATLMMLPLGAYGLYSFPETVALSLLGVTVIGLVVLHRSFQKTQLSLLKNRWTASAFGILSGFIGGAFATPGPVVVAYLYASHDSRAVAKANAQFALAVVGVAILVIHFLLNNSLVERLPQAAIYVPIVLGFTSIGAATARKIPLRTFSLVTDALLCSIGIYLIYRALM